jgi:hypothetical protein
LLDWLHLTLSAQANSQHLGGDFSQKMVILAIFSNINFLKTV